MLQKYGHGIIGSSACIAGIIPKLLDNRQFDDAVEWARRFASCFDEGDFYIELQNQGLRTDAGMTQTELNRQLTKVAQLAGLKTIATNDFHYLKKEDAKAQDIMLCIGTGSAVNDANRMRFENDEFYMKTEEEMREALSEFPRRATTRLRWPTRSTLCSNATPFCRVSARGRNRGKLVSQAVRVGLEESTAATQCPKRHDRYEYEAGIILQQGFPAYFLIVQEYIAWARSQGIGVGPGRGSAAGAICTYAMGITDLDPLPNGLLFERFLSPERVEMPDIDVDFEDERRQEVIEHIKEVYGGPRVGRYHVRQAAGEKRRARCCARA